jgi:putative ABC transport system permease protein
LLDRLRAIDQIEEVAGFGPIVDARNGAVPGAPKVGIRRAYGSVGSMVLTASLPRGEEHALASAAAVETLGLHDGVGELVTDDGSGVVVTGRLEVPAHLAFLEPLVLIPSSSSATSTGANTEDPLAVVVILARTPQDVSAVEATVRGLLAPDDPSGVTVETSAELAAIRAAVHGELGSYGRSTVLIILAVAALLVVVNLLGLVTMRRRDFGRRRALGASQSLIVSLLLGQVGVLAVIGAAAGVGVALAWLVLAGHRVPDTPFIVAVAVAAILVAAVAASVPAMVASRRDPLHELCVP